LPQLRCTFLASPSTNRTTAPPFYPLSLHDALPISTRVNLSSPERVLFPDDGITKGDLFEYYRAVAPAIVPHLRDRPFTMKRWREDRKSTRLNSSHVKISYAVFCLKKKIRTAPPFLY